ncbi:hypothetical protein [Bradyrhizobium manausense]|uniref:Uncharacterized protein n=1 Tax=Bradyrhizobium manausense TaxID=989370 RepID=A0A0R3CZS8_9BRAD|nr:hypothetical protein [Bradyrhizobium manausense]KRQ03034.1 hypothetical protein AOQ71_30125 [Bradyrhizobium manausense]
MTGENTRRTFRIGFQTSIITVFLGVVLLVGLTLVYLSFASADRATADRDRRLAASWRLQARGYGPLHRRGRLHSKTEQADRWDEVFAGIAQDGAAEATLVRFSGFLHDYPGDSVARFTRRGFATLPRGRAPRRDP